MTAWTCLMEDDMAWDRSEIRDLFNRVTTPPLRFLDADILDRATILELKATDGRARLTIRVWHQGARVGSLAPSSDGLKILVCYAAEALKAHIKTRNAHIGQALDEWFDPKVVPDT